MNTKRDINVAILFVPPFACMLISNTVKYNVHAVGYLLTKS